MVVNVLLIDDEQAFLEIARINLKRDPDIRVHESHSAENALQKLKDERYDVIVADYQMPGMNGIELLKKLKSEGSATPFILFTGKGREDVVIDALNNGAAFYLQKGGDPKSQFAELTNMIKRAAREAQIEKAHSELLDELQESHLLMSATIESTADGILGIDREGNVLVHNRRFSEMWRIPESVMRSKHRDQMMTFVLDQLKDPDRFKNMVYEGFVKLDRETNEILEFRDGRVFEYQSRPMRVKDSVVGWIATFRDITDRERSEVILRQEKDRAQQYLSLAGVMLLALDEHGRVALINKKGCEILGYEEEQILEKSWFENFLPEDRRSDVRNIFDRLMQGELEPLEYQPPAPILCKGGVVKYVAFTNALLRNERGEITGTLSSGEDVTVRRQAEEALRMSLAKYASLLESLPFGVTISDESGNIVESNREAEHLLGLSREDQVKRQIDGKEWRIIRRDGSPMPAGEYASVRALKEKRRVKDVEMGIVRDDGITTWINVTAAPIPLAGNGVAITYTDISERKKAEDAFRASEERFRRLVEGMLEGVAYCKMIYDDSGRPVNWTYLSVNDNFEKLTGLKDIVGKKVTEAIPGIDRLDPGLFEIYGRVARTGLPETFESEIKSIGQWLKISVFCPEKDHFVAVFEDVTDRKKAVESLRKSEAKFAASFNSSPEIMMINSLKDGRIVDVNRSFLKTMGFSREEVLGKTISEIGVVDEIERRRLMEDFETKRGLKGLETRARTKNGEEKIGLFSAEMIAIEGEPCMLSVISDITDRVRVEQAAREVEVKFQSFMNHLPAVCYMLDSSDRYIYANKVFEDMLGARADAILGKSVNELWPPSTAVPFAKIHHQVLSTQRPVELIESVPMKEGRREFLTLVFPVPALSSGPKIIGGISIDVTEQRRVEKALRQANKKLNLLGQVTRHDAINQLSIITAWLDIAMEIGKDLPTKEQMERIKDAAGILQRQLEFTAEYQEMGIKQPQWIDLRVAAETGFKGIALGTAAVDLDLNEIQVFADPMLQRVFHNLLDNSVRHGEKVRTISLRAKESDKGLLVSYEDDGIGIQADDKEKIFVRGFGKHTGFGLYLAREILGITGIQIKENGEPGKGAKFEMLVPNGIYKIGNRS